MNPAQDLWIETLRRPHRPPGLQDPRAVSRLSDTESSQAFVLGLFLAAALHRLVDQHWLLTRGEPAEQSSFDDFIHVAFARELAPLEFLSPLIHGAGSRGLKALQLAVAETLGLLIDHSRGASDESHRRFARESVANMAALSVFETELGARRIEADDRWRLRLSAMTGQSSWLENRPRMDEGLLPESLYRAFDEMDEIFLFDYGSDRSMKSDATTTERLYEGSGQSVQTSYSTIFTVLERLQPRVGAHLVDLGSGFGRLGLVAGLWREDLWLTGYEYVGHRVKMARAAAVRAGLGDRVRFEQQDLSQKDFVIPAADVYYMYDPFQEDTYRHVIARLLEVGRGAPATVVTKGGAGDQFADASRGDGWSCQLHEGGNVKIFSSR